MPVINEFVTSALSVPEISLGLLIHAPVGIERDLGSPLTKVAGISHKLVEEPRPFVRAAFPPTHREPRTALNIPSRCDDARGCTKGKTRRRIGAHLDNKQSDRETPGDTSWS